MKTLEIKWSISRGRDTEGYNICTLWDGDKPYRTCGGGYDMRGTVLAKWLWANYKDKLMELDKDKCDKAYSAEIGGYYGFIKSGDKYYLDGACGNDCMKAIAKAIGLTIRTICNRKGQATHYIIEEPCKTIG